jgi:hypothetical protein
LISIDIDPNRNDLSYCLNLDTATMSDAFNSSDVEVEDLPDPHAHRGRFSIDKVLESAMELRIKSKKKAEAVERRCGRTIQLYGARYVA